MKEKLTTLLHALMVGLGGLGGFLVEKDLISAEDTAKVDAAGGTLGAVLAVIGGCIVAHLAAKVFKNLGGGGSGGNAAAWAMTATAAGISMAGCLLSSCVVGVDERGGWSVRPDPLTVDAGLKYLIRHDDDAAKGGLTQWRYYDPETGTEIPEEDYAAWGIKP